MTGLQLRPSFVTTHSLSALAPGIPSWQDVSIRNNSVLATGNYHILRPLPIGCNCAWTEIDVLHYFLFRNKGESVWLSRSPQQHQKDLLKIASKWSHSVTRFYLYHHSSPDSPIAFPPCTSERELRLLLSTRLWTLLGVPTAPLRLTCVHTREENNQGPPPFW